MSTQQAKKLFGGINGRSRHADLVGHSVKFLSKGELMFAVRILKSVVEYCAIDDPFAVDSKGKLDVKSANNRKKDKCRETLKSPTLKRIFPDLVEK